MTAASLDESRDLLARIHLLERSGDLERSAIVRAVERGVAERRVVELDYTDRDGNATTGRQVEPYGLAGSEYGWYLLGWCRLRDGQRVFRLDRIEAIRVTDEAAPDRGWTGPLPEPWRRPELE